MPTSKQKSLPKSKRAAIVLKKVFVHNLKGIDLEVPRGELITLCGVSGSGKSSLAFDTIFREGQRQYLDAMLISAKRQIGGFQRPDAEAIEGLTPTIAVEQKTGSMNARSTVGTLTEIYDFLRVLFAKAGTPYCPVSGEPIEPRSREEIAAEVFSFEKGTRLIVLAPVVQGKKSSLNDDIKELIAQGFVRARLDGTFFELESPPEIDPSKAHTLEVVVDRIKIEKKSRIDEALFAALEIGKGICTIHFPEDEREMLFSTLAYSKKSGLSYKALEPSDFSFNTTRGMCEKCSGLGRVMSFDLEKVIDPNKSIEEECCSIAPSIQTVRYGNIYRNLSELYDFNLSDPWHTLSKKAQKAFLYGINKRWTKMKFIHPTTKKKWVDYVRWNGVLGEAWSRYESAASALYKGKMESLMQEDICPSCEGSRLKPYPSQTKLGRHTIHELTSLSAEEALEALKKTELSPEKKMIGEDLLLEAVRRLEFVVEVGLDYLSLSRPARTLSGGEAQRVRLAAHLGCGLVDITYILDEPTIGLHPRDNRRLIGTLLDLKARGNTVIVVEHDEEMIRASDRVIEIGPGAGVEGGLVTFEGSPEELLKDPHSLTGKYLSRKEGFKKRAARKSKAHITLTHANANNLKDVTLKLPLGMLTTVVGLSGSGKSSLIMQTLLPRLQKALKEPISDLLGSDQIDKVIAISQSPIGRGPRSNPATYVKVFDEIRDLFAELPESQLRGYKKGRFSFNVAEGSCPKCSGMGEIKIDMDFMEAEWISCPTCHGERFDSQTLDVLYKGKNISQVLKMSINAALEHFAAIPSIHAKLALLQKVGLGYVKLGQSSTTLSGGEAQRIKLSKELARPSTSKTLYILDEPTVGLHLRDIGYLMDILHGLCDKGNSVAIIEHNTDVMLQSDWLIELGPKGGSGGGKIIAEGSPKTFVKKTTPTAKALLEHLENRIPKLEKRADAPEYKELVIRGARMHNLKNINLELPRGAITAITGPSGSGKSSLAFNTIFAEGQRRYVDTLSAYMRQFVKQMPRPHVDTIDGLTPAIAIEQKSHGLNPRSTVGTMSEIYDYLRLLFSHVAIPHCPETGEPIEAISKERVAESLIASDHENRIVVLAPMGDAEERLLKQLKAQGHLRVRIGKEICRLDEPIKLGAKEPLALVIDRLRLTQPNRPRLLEAIELAARAGDSKLMIEREGKEELFFNLAFAVPSTGKSYPEINHHTFSFNTKEGMCTSCLGLGTAASNIRSDSALMECSIEEILNMLWPGSEFYLGNEAFEPLFQKYEIDPDAPLKELNAKQRSIFFKGAPQDKKELNRWRGLITVFEELRKFGNPFIKEKLSHLLEETLCPACHGARLNPLALAATINKSSIADLCAWPIAKARTFICDLKLSKEERIVLKEVLHQLISRLDFLEAIGLGYLSLNRSAPTLSGGELQRLRLARQLGSGLSGMLYVLDEPTIGLHPSEIERLNKALKRLQALGNTLIMVEHDPLAISACDYLVEMGPGSGHLGGDIIYIGEAKKGITAPTAEYVWGNKKIEVKTQPPKLLDGISIKGAKDHNLKDIEVHIPRGGLTCFAGPSGSGKSTLLSLLLTALDKKPGQAQIEGLEHFTNSCYLSQNPVGSTTRSDVATYVDLLAPLRQWFAKLPEAQIKGLEPKHFSYYHKKGMCTNCFGFGYKTVQLQFLPPVQVPCSVCDGKRLNARSLSILYLGKSLAHYLALSPKELLPIFEHIPKAERILRTLIDVGLDYLPLNREIATLSGGEAQRIRLSRDLAKKSRGKTLYLFDEPTIGLSFADVEKLLKVLFRLRRAGHTIIIIEHNTDILRHADHIIELGPVGGEDGGYLIAEGNLEAIRKSKKSITGKYL